MGYSTDENKFSHIDKRTICTPLAGTGNSEVVLVMKKTSGEETHSARNPSSTTSRIMFSLQPSTGFLLYGQADFSCLMQEGEFSSQKCTSLHAFREVV
jgi:hypothetical protein